MSPRRTTTNDLLKTKAAGEAFAVVTAYDYTSARLADAAGIPVVLVGDSMAQAILGLEDTLPVTVDDMVRAGASVARGVARALVVVDMPFMSYQASEEDALRNAGRLLKEGGAHAVKLEGGASILGTVRALGRAGVAVMGHLGLTPQSVHKLGGYRVQGRTLASAREMIRDALALEEAGAFAIVLELVPAELADEITARLTVPTIGIGSGPGCDGQVQVWHDILGLTLDFEPRHAKRYLALGTEIQAALETYAREVRERRFPSEAQTTHLREPLDLGGVDHPSMDEGTDTAVER